MRVFLAGATGAIGKRLVPLLVASGHSVAATTRRAERAPGLRAMGAEPVVVDALDRDAIHAAVMTARPDVIVHQLTAIPERFNFLRFDRAFTATNRLRTEGTNHLLAAAQMAGTRRIVAQSFAGWPYARTEGWVKSEDDPLDSNPPPAFRNTLAAIRHLETAVLNATGIDGVVLRFGAFYGPGTSIGEGGALLNDIVDAAFPLSAQGPGFGRSCTSTMRHAPRRARSARVLQAFTTLSTMNRRASPNGCRSSPPHWAPKRRLAFPRSSPAWRSAATASQ